MQSVFQITHFLYIVLGWFLPQYLYLRPLSAADIWAGGPVKLLDVTVKSVEGQDVDPDEMSSQGCITELLAKIRLARSRFGALRSLEGFP